MSSARGSGEERRYVYPHKLSCRRMCKTEVDCLLKMSKPYVNKEPLIFIRVKLCGYFKRIFGAVNLIIRALDDDEVLPLNCFHLPPRKLGLLTVKASVAAADTAASAMTGPNNAPLPPFPFHAPRCCTHLSQGAVRRCLLGWLVRSSLDARWIA